MLWFHNTKTTQYTTTTTVEKRTFPKYQKQFKNERFSTVKKSSKTNVSQLSQTIQKRTFLNYQKQHNTFLDQNSNPKFVRISTNYFVFFRSKF